MKRLMIGILWTLLLMPIQAQESLLISELLYQPTSGEAEYVELYNHSGTEVELADYHIVRWIGDSLGRHYPLPEHTVAPHTYVVLTKDAASVEACFEVAHPALLIECNLPTYPNAGGSVVLCTADSLVVDRLDYTPDMHSPLLRNKAGVSLERRSFDRPTNEASNWFSAASTAGYGTPTAPNSQSSEQIAEEAWFNFSTEIVSPDGDGYQDEVEIDYHMERSDLAARAEIYDRRGRMVHRLLNGGLMGASGKLQWSGTDATGTRLPAGQYVILITLYDTTGTQQTLRRAIAVL